MTKVAIIGAGCAGLGAAQALLKNGGQEIEVVLIDAFERLGGRARTNSEYGFPFDMGPQFIQDPGINPWMKIAKELDFETLPAVLATVYRISNDGIWQDMQEPPEAVSAVINRLNASYESAEADKNKPAMMQIPVNDAATQIALGSDGLGSVGESVEPWQYIASDRARQAHVAEEDGGIVYVKAGLGSLVAAFGRSVIEQYPEQLTVKMGETVTRLHWDPIEGKLEIMAGYKSLDTADYCIVSVPCSVIPGIAFIPPLDQIRVVANGYVELGSYKKVAFCPEEMPGDIQTETEYYMYDDQLKGCWQYFRLPTAPQALIGVATGNFAARLDRLGDGVAAQGFLDALKTAYPGDEIVPANPPLVTNWSNQEHIGGAYSYTRYDGGDPDDPTAFDARVEIGKPHADGRILFAGEATWTEAYGTIHGAYNSGVRAALRILNMVGLA